MRSNKFLNWSGKTHSGRFRKNNEDSFLALTFDELQVSYLGRIGESDMESGDFVFAVSDGMGGANSGEFASRIAINKITKLLPTHFNKSSKFLEDQCSTILSELFLQIHKEMHHFGRCYSECQGMGATLSLCWLRPDHFIISHIGDSRIYYLPKDGGLKQLTHDHTHAGWLRRQGKLNEREERTHPEANQLQQVLGGKTDIPDPQIFMSSYEVGDRFLICSDGIVDGIWDHNLETIIRNPSTRFDGLDPSERLLKEAIEESGRDNVTALVIEVSEKA